MARRDEAGKVRKERPPKDRRKRERRYRHGGRRGRRDALSTKRRPSRP